MQIQTMSSKIPKKKVDFFNGGRGVNLSQYESNGYQESSSPDSPEINVEDRNESGSDHPSYYPESDEPDASMSPPSYAYSAHEPQETSPSCYSPLPANYPHHPSVYYHPYNPTDIHTTSNYLQYGAPSHHLPNGCQPLGQIPPPPSFPPHVSSSMHGPYPGPSAFPESSYASSFMGHDPYSPLRSMDHNGLHGMNLPFSDVGAKGGNISYEELPAGAGGGGTKKKKRQQKCSLCCNHGVQVDVKGHKWFCKYRNCECERCTITRGRQHHMKEQQKLTRHLQRLQ